ncbi:hypothetical protein KIF24_16760 [Micromonospora sp. Llam7]|uniref:hypothetical protein n=1 Tax=Micromonospora tarapacensis TaxID=2835305 RepID=UPI001C836C95|nr:hypothetical protein [Micromonospora tarapacensis]MBX7267515.1 hypothetical protein [Micromonospora tarapacensis]
MDDDAPWTSARLVAADVEGNGQQPPRLVELAVVPIDAGVIGDPVSWLVRPPSPIRLILDELESLAAWCSKLLSEHRITADASYYSKLSYLRDVVHRPPELADATESVSAT